MGKSREVWFAAYTLAVGSKHGVSHSALLCFAMSSQSVLFTLCFNAPTTTGNSTILQSGGASQILVPTAVTVGQYSEYPGCIVFEIPSSELRTITTGPPESLPTACVGFIQNQMTTRTWAVTQCVTSNVNPNNVVMYLTTTLSEP